MKNFKKFMALGLALIMVLSMAACGGDANKTTEGTTKATNEATTQGTTVSTAAPTPTPDPQPYKGMEFTLISAQDMTAGGNNDSWYLQGAFHAALDEWCEAQGATWTQMVTKDNNTWLAATASGHAPDLYFGYGQWPTLANLGLVQSIDDYADMFAEKYGENNVKDGMYGGKSYAVYMPYNEYTIIKYNLTKFEEYGVKTPREYFEEGTWDWAAMQEVLKGITKDTNGDGEMDIVGFGGHHVANSFNARGFEVSEAGKLSLNLDSARNRALYQILYEEHTLNKTVKGGVNAAGQHKDGYYMAMSIATMDPYDVSRNIGVYSTDANGDVWEFVPIPEWEVGKDEEYSVMRNFFQMAVPTGAQNLEASISLMDYLIEAACAREFMPGFGPGTDYVGLEGTTEDSKAYVKWYTDNYNAYVENLEALPEYDEAYVKKVIEYLESKPSHHELNFSGVAGNLTTGTNFQDLWLQPAATSIVAMSEKLKAQLDSYNSKYVFE